MHQGKLRFFAPDGAVVPTETEAEGARADKAEQDRVKLAAKLRELGIDPDSLR